MSPIRRRSSAGWPAAVAEGGLLILSTPNRTTWSQLLLIVLAEATGQIPKGTHDWDKFITPEELKAMVEGAGLKVTDMTGLGFSLTRGFTLTADLSLNYLVTAKRA